MFNFVRGRDDEGDAAVPIAKQIAQGQYVLILHETIDSVGLTGVRSSV